MTPRTLTRRAANEDHGDVNENQGCVLLAFPDPTRLFLVFSRTACANAYVHDRRGPCHWSGSDHRLWVLLEKTDQRAGR